MFRKLFSADAEKKYYLRRVLNENEQSLAYSKQGKWIKSYIETERFFFHLKIFERGCTCCIILVSII